MRRLALALVLLSSPFSALPGHAQWWGPGGPGPCYGPCRPWAGRIVGFGPLGRPIVLLRVRPWVRRWAFERDGFGWQPAFRRPPGERRWADAEPRREAVEPAPPPAVRHRAPPPAVRSVAAQFRPRPPVYTVRAAPALPPASARPAPSAVAVMPAAALPPVRDVPRAVIRASVLSTAKILRRPAHPPAAEPVAVRAAPRPPIDGAAPAVTPAALRSDGPAAATQIAPAAGQGGKPSDVPAAPLD